MSFRLFTKYISVLLLVGVYIGCDAQDDVCYYKRLCLSSTGSKDMPNCVEETGDNAIDCKETVLYQIFPNAVPFRCERLSEEACQKDPYCDIAKTTCEGSDRAKSKKVSDH